ncbi:Ig-like domain-containing protein [Paenibacillus yanchengensis]|uniref:Ig-like domain-containing protein n=1 Tax=Paenibacillus yanchengensis TaxID=2035833 RepID=A0ABW4YFR2_9BACL
MKLAKKIAVFCLAIMLITSSLGVVQTHASNENEFNPEGVSFEKGLNIATQERLSEAPQTVEAWVKIPSTVPNNERVGVILGNYFENYYDDISRFNFEINQNSNPRIYWKSGVGNALDYSASDVKIKRDEWTHIAITLDEFANKAVTYINGAKAHEGTFNVPLPNNRPARELKIGSDYRVDTNNNPTMKFKGELADVRVWSTVRTASEIKSSYNTDLNGDEAGLMGNWKLDALVEENYLDSSSQKNHAKRYNEETTNWLEGEFPKGDYSIAIIPDTQYLVRYHEKEYMKHMQWIKDNAEELKIKLAIQVGDLVDQPNNDQEWKVSQKGMELLDGVVPYVFSPGNHDMTLGKTSLTRDTTKYNQYYPYSKYSQAETFGGAFKEGKMDNTYHKFEIEGMKYLVLAMEFAPNDNVLEWANKIIADNQDYKVIISTHSYMYHTGEQITTKHMDYPSKYIDDGNNGDDMWNELVRKHKNIILVTSGHIGYPDIVVREDAGDYGNKVQQVLADAQFMQGDLGMIMLMTFNKDSNKVDVNWYSVTKNKFYRASNQFSMDLNLGTYDPTLVSSIKITGENDRTTITTNGGSLQFSATVSPEEANNKDINWAVTELDGNKTEKATISSDGILIAKRNGLVKVIGTAADGSKVSGHKVISISGQETYDLFDQKTFNITVKHSGLNMDVNGSSTNDGAKIIQWNKSVEYNQQWTFIQTDSGYYKIVSKHSSKVLAVEKASVENNNAPIIQTTYTADENYNDEWSILETDNGYYQLINRASGKAIGINNGSKSGSEAFTQSDQSSEDYQKLLFSLDQRVEHNKTGNGLYQLQYSPGWSAYDNHYSNLKNASVTLRFTGTQVKLYGVKSNDQGIIAISIDDGPETFIDAYAPERKEGQFLYQSPLLTNKEHKVNIRITGTKNEAAKNTYFTLNYMDIISKVDQLADSIAITTTEAEITKKGETLQLEAIVLPEDAINKDVIWNVYETDGGVTDKATISVEGLLTAVKNGEVKVVATAAGGIDVAAEKFVTISGQEQVTEDVKVTEVVISSENDVKEITTKGGTLQLEAAVTPENATDKAVVWSVSNTSLAAISTDGLLTAKANGTVTVTATAADGSEVFGEIDIAISGQDEVTEDVKVTEVVISSVNDVKEITTRGGILQLNAKITPDNATNKKVVWTVSDTNRAAISTDGLLTAKANGTVTVTATAADGSKVFGILDIAISGQDEVTEDVKVTEVVISSVNDVKEITTKGGTLELTAKVMPEEATNKAVVWTVSDTSLATITTDGFLTAKANGTVTVTATAADGSKVFGELTIVISGQSTSSGGGGYYPPYNPEVKPTPIEEDTDDKDGENETPTKPTDPELPMPEFSDLAGHWAQEAIMQAVQRGIITGYADETVKPNAVVTREEFVVMLMRTLQVEKQVTTKATQFTDAKEISDWSKDAIAEAVQLGIVNGYRDGSFRPKAEISRAEMAKLIVQALQLSDVTVDHVATPFADDKEIADWAKPYVAIAAQYELIKGKGQNQFVPNAAATRAEAIVMLLRM